MNKIKTAELIGEALDWAVSAAQGDSDIHTYSTNWEDGGPIIERELCELVKCKSGNEVFWEAVSGLENTPAHTTAYGPTPLIAAMRCYVASKLGDTVDIPAELFTN